MAHNGKVQIKDDFAVVKNGQTGSFNLNLGNCASFCLMFKPSATHTYKVDILWDGLISEEIISSASQGNKLTSIIDVKTPYAKITITNSDVSNDRTYDVYLYTHD